MPKDASPLDFGRIGNRLWRFSHASGYVASEGFQFLADGRIGGYKHRNECYWRIENGILCLLDIGKVPTIRFEEVYFENDRLTLTGRHLPNPDIILCLHEGGPHDKSASQKITRRSVRSFDIFDTLIARSVTHPSDVFDIVELSGVPNFKELRLRAQALSNHTWSDIYAHYKHLSGIEDADVARIQALELEAEAAVSYLVSDIYHRVRDGDILVSDMYLPRESLAALLNSVGFNKEVEIFVSPAGKSSGQIWPVLKESFEIEHHVGDNVNSDVDSPASHGIPSSHYSGSQLAPMEALLVKVGAPKTATVFKKVRLTNPFSLESREFRLHNAQALANLPFLLMMSFHLWEIMERESLSRLLFTTRDSCLLQQIFELLFPDVDSRIFYSSRIAMVERRPSYVEYVKQSYVPGGTLIFDLHGAFRSGRQLFQELFGTLPRVHIFGGVEGRATNYAGLTFDIPQGTIDIEAFNLDRVGSLVTVDGNGQPIRVPLPAESAEVGALYRTVTMRLIEALRPNVDIVRNELLPLRGAFPWSEIHQHILNTAAGNGIPEVRGAGLVEHQSLTQIMNEVRSDKGSTYACAHCYTFLYERLMQELILREHITLLEIGLNRDGIDDIPSIRGWRRYLGNKVTLYGVDVDPRLSRHHDPGAGIHILIADQSRAQDLVRCGVANPKGYDVIIDGGSHMSSHQQITLRTLWQFLLPGGIYVIEHLHFQPQVETTMRTRDLIRLWRDGNPASTPHIQRPEAARIIEEASGIELHDSLSQRWGNETRDSLAVIRKQI